MTKLSINRELVINSLRKKKLKLEKNYNESNQTFFKMQENQEIITIIEFQKIIFHSNKIINIKEINYEKMMKNK